MKVGFKNWPQFERMKECKFQNEEVHMIPIYSFFVSAIPDTKLIEMNCKHKASVAPFSREHSQLDRPAVPQEL